MYQIDSDRIEAALRRARHSRDVFLKSYNTPIHPEQLRDFNRLLECSGGDTQLELIMLG